MADKHSIDGARRKSSTRLIAIAIALIVVASLALTYIFTDVFDESTQWATVKVNSIEYRDDTQYEIYLNRTGEMLADGTLVCNGSVVHKFEGFAAEEIMFRHTGWPDQDWICPLLLSDGQILQINIWPEGGVGWQLSY